MLKHKGAQRAQITAAGSSEIDYASMQHGGGGQGYAGDGSGGDGTTEVQVV